MRLQRNGRAYLTKIPARIHKRRRIIIYMMLTISHGLPTDIRDIIVAEAGGRQNNTQIMNTNQFSLANRKQLADILADKYDSLRSKAKNKLREKHQALYSKLLDESAEKKGALKFVEQIKVARQKISDLEHELLMLGFQENHGDLYTNGDVGNTLRRSIEARVDKELGTSDGIDARFDSLQLAMMTVASLEDADKLLKSVTTIQ